MSVILTPGQAGDNPHLLLLLDQIAVRRDGSGRPRKRPDRILADKAYSHPSTRATLRSGGIVFTSPSRHDQIARGAARGCRGDRPPWFDQHLYARAQRGRTLLQPTRTVPHLATRYAKRAAYYRAEILVAATVLWLHEDSQDTA